MNKFPPVHLPTPKNIPHRSPANFCLVSYKIYSQKPATPIQKNPTQPLTPYCPDTTASSPTIQTNGINIISPVFIHLSPKSGHPSGQVPTHSLAPTLVNPGLHFSIKASPKGWYLLASYCKTSLRISLS